MSEKTYKILLAAAIALILFGLGNYLLNRNAGAPVPPDTAFEPENAEEFSGMGYLSDRYPDQPNRGLHFVFDEAGNPARSLELRFDGQSNCVLTGDSVPCLALSMDIDSAAGNKQVFVEGIRNNSLLLIRTLAIDAEADRKFGFIRRAEKNGVNGLVEIDEVEFLSGDVAYEAAARDTECTKENAHECVPSLNNDFYIRNTSEATEVYNITEETRIQIFASPGSPVLEDVNMEEFLRRYADRDEFMQAYPFMYLLDGATVTRLVEQYVP